MKTLSLFSWLRADLACAVVGLAFGNAVARTVFVSLEGVAAARGTSWTDAKDLTSALAGAAENDELWLKQGGGSLS